MWVGLDWFGQLLVDATLATAILLSLVILLMLLCQQPTRRIVLAQAATVLAIFMFPLVATNPLSRLSTLAWFTGHEPGAEPHTVGFLGSRRFPRQSLTIRRHRHALRPDHQGRVPGGAVAGHFGFSRSRT